MGVKRVLLGAAIVALVGGTQVPGVRGGEDPGEWRRLFDGTSTKGWEQVGPGSFELKDGVLTTKGGMGLLWYSQEKLGDRTIRVVYRTHKPEENSGVFIRIADKPTDEWFAVHHGYEVQICDQTDEYHRTGAIYSLSKAGKQPAKVGEWNTLEITLEGDLVRVSVNGVEVNRFDPAGPVPPRTKDYEPERGPRPAAGYIGLQNHDEASRVEFREVSVMPLAKP